MAALAEAPPAPVAPAAVGCRRAGCVERGTACGRCLRDGGAVEHVALTDGQASLILRHKLARACVEGQSFDQAWRYATAAVIMVAPDGQAYSWRVTLEALRPDFAAAFRDKRLKMTTPAESRDR